MRAWRSHRALFNTGRSLGDEPLLISMLIRMAIDVMAVQSLERALAQTQLPAKWLDERRQAFEEEMAVPFFAIGMRGERAGHDFLCRNIETGKLNLPYTLDLGRLKRNEPSWTDIVDNFYAQSMVLNSHATLLRFETALVEASRLPPEQRYAALRQLHDSIKTQFKRDDKSLILAWLLLPALTKVAEAEQRVHSQLACAVSAMAVERFRVENQRWPDFLDEAMQEVPLDRWDAQPIRYRRTADGVVIYSIGKYFSSQTALYDGTALDDLSTFDSTNSRVEFRLWDPDRRCQPVLPAGKAKR
jgi:hypothetical protein